MVVTPPIPIHIALTVLEGSAVSSQDSGLMVSHGSLMDDFHVFNHVTATYNIYCELMAGDFLVRYFVLCSPVPPSPMWPCLTE
jgi:hypothetical protein